MISKINHIKYNDLKFIFIRIDKSIALVCDGAELTINMSDQF